MVPPIRPFPPARITGLGLILALFVSMVPLGMSAADDQRSSALSEPVKTEAEAKTETESDTETVPSAETKTAAPTKPEPKPTPSPTPAPASELFPVGSVERPLIVRTFLPNLLKAPGLFPNHRPSATATGYDAATGDDTDTLIEPIAGLPAAIAVSFGDRLSFVWDTVECRWLYAWRGGFLSINDSDPLPRLNGDIVYLAQGNAPLSTSIGAVVERVKFYGYRSVDGVPEFLYTIGSLKVAERIQPGDDGETIVQHFNVERNQFDLMLAAPSASASDATSEQPSDATSEQKEVVHSISVINGKLDGDFAVISKKNAADFALVHSIGTPLDRPGTTKDKTLSIPLLTQNSRPAIKARPVVLPPAKPEPEPEPEPKPSPTPPPSPAADSETMVAADATPAADKSSDPAPASTTKTKVAGPIITSARRYDRDILLTDPHIEAGAMNKDSTAFSDRDFKFSDLPDELVGADYVRTFDRDKYIPGDILSYRLQLDSDASVYVLFDKRLDPMPKWVDHRFEDTGKTAALGAGRDFRVMRADADAGEFTFGPQDSGTGAHFYIIAATPRGKTEAGDQKAEPRKQTARSKK